MRTATCTARTATTIEARQRTGMRRLLPGPGAARQGPLLLALLFLLIGSLAHAEAPGPARVRELLDHRCVVCHACYDAPCQLKLGAWDGLLRGASKQLVYDGTRLKEAAPTRLFIDAQSSTQWRQKGFFSALDGADGTAGSDASDSGVLHRMLALKEHNPLPETALLPGDLDVSINRAQSCPTPQEFDRFAQQHPADFGRSGEGDHPYTAVMQHRAHDLAGRARRAALCVPGVRPRLLCTGRFDGAAGGSRRPRVRTLSPVNPEPPSCGIRRRCRFPTGT